MANKKKTTKEEDELTLTAKLDRFWKGAENARRERDWKWFQYDLWVNGNHYAKWDRRLQQITTINPSDGKPKVTINKVYSVIRSVRNYVVRNEPKPDVTPDDLTPDTLEQAANLNKFLDYLYARLGLRLKLRATVWHALKYSVGYWQVLYDDEAEEGQGEIQINVVDPYDLYWDPTARYPEEARYCILAVKRNIADLKEDPKYKSVDWDEVTSENQLAASTLKARLLEYERGGLTGTTGDKEDGTTILKEYWIKEKQSSDASQENSPQAGIKVRIIAKAGDKIIRNELTELDRLPFFRLPSDVEPLQMYGHGWVKNIIPINRLYERLMGSVAEYNDLMNKGKWIADKGAGVRIINNDNGQIIEKKRGFEVAQGAIQPLSAAIFQQIDILTRDFEDLSSFHDASLGRIPNGAKSGVSIEALQEGDSNNLSELTENTEDFLSRVYEYVLYLASQKYQFARNVIIDSKTGEKEFIKVIGADASTVQSPSTGAMPMGPQGATIIGKKNVVSVKIDSWLAYTSEGRRDAIKELAGLLAAQGTPMPIQYILEAYETGNIADIIKQIQDDQAKQQQMQAEQQQQQAQAQAQAQSQAAIQQQQASQPQPAGQVQAVAVIRQIVNGRMPQSVPQVVGPAYIQEFDQFIQGAGSNLPPEILQELQHIRDHAAATMQGGAQPSIYAQQAGAQPAQGGGATQQ
jgi:type II secretory pathway pseudopilin PulG